MDDWLAAWGKAWIATGDAYAPAGLVAALDGATDPATGFRRGRRSEGPTSTEARTPQIASSLKPLPFRV
jgi:hypothetical protein